jgi:DNA-binding LacI/PurR family transcriptional regulator
MWRYIEMRKPTSKLTISGNVTIKHIAKYLGISHSTVSRALSDHPYTNAGTKNKVRQAVDKLGYVPHSAARTLRKDKGSLVGLILPDIRNELFATAAHVIAQRCLKAGLQLALSISEDDPIVEFKHVTALREARAVGIILTPSAGILDKTVALLHSMPIVQFSRRHTKLNAPSASVDGERALMIGTSHLLQLGHRRISYIGAEREKSTGAERLEGYAKAHRRFNVRLDPALAYLGPTHRDFGHAAVSELLRVPDPPSAFVLGSNALMPGALGAFRHAGLHIPRSISLVGFGDPTWYVQWGDDGITTLGMSLQDLAEAAASQLMRQLQPSDANAKAPMHFALEPFFLLRGTTAPWKRSSALRTRNLLVRSARNCIATPASRGP